MGSQICLAFLFLCSLCCYNMRQNYDIILRPDMNDLNTVPGLLTAARDLLRLKPGGLCFAGVPCSSQLVINY